ncbi:MAG: hypothetical protein JNL38_06375 [Myxococcales bacterium]|nr:hypothetical protein [Myxococcales bacterium]
MMKRVAVLLALGLVALTVAGCPLGRKSAELGEECASANDCPMGTTGLMCSGQGVGGKKFCTKACTSDADCTPSKVAPMSCVASTCVFKK